MRAVLLVREVLGFSADEAATMLDTTRASINSALQRARSAVVDPIPEKSQQAELAYLGTDGVGNLVDAFVTAWERADVDALLELLTADVRFTMPPLPAWFHGRDEVGRFIAERVFATTWKLEPVRSNGQPAFACYQNTGDGFFLGVVNLLSIRDGRIMWVAGFINPTVCDHFEQKFFSEGPMNRRGQLSLYVRHLPNREVQHVETDRLQHHVTGRLRRGPGWQHDGPPHGRIL